MGKTYKGSTLYNDIESELCRRVGLEYPPPSGEKYQVDAATWTKAEEDDYRAWLYQYLRTKPTWKNRGKNYIKSEVDWFIFGYSWKYKEI